MPQAFGFVGDHKYANLTPEQAYIRIRVCRKHFDDESFTSSGKHLLTTAVPLKFPTKLDGNDQNNDNPGPSSVLAPSKLDACTQTDTCHEVEQDVSCQTSSKLSNSSPRKQGLRRRIKELQSELKSSKRRKTVTREDVEQFLDEQYPQEATMLMKNQLTLLDKNPKGARYSKEVKHFALSLFLLGPEAYKKLSKVMRLPSPSTLRKLTEHWKITPGFNEFIFKILELRVPLMSGKTKDCILCIDEMSIKSNLFYNVSRDVVVSTFIKSSSGHYKVAVNQI
ncbi:uncharacterized protein isoform X2 [Leptinotarsa decemlineata]|uniref:uncharacterized protein isoform X2 n=1 Tax=Leptinotarsa decemlineata TaxID=7539 RepID=UPI003D304640